MYTRIPEKGSFQFQSVTSADSSSTPNFVVDHIEEETSYHQTVSLDGQSYDDNGVMEYENVHAQNKSKHELDRSKNSLVIYALFFIAGSLVTTLMYRMTSKMSNESFILGKKTYSCSLRIRSNDSFNFIVYLHQEFSLILLHLLCFERYVLQQH